MNIEHMFKKLVELNAIQDISLQLYGKYDLNKSIIWMVEELGEVIAAIRKGNPKQDITAELGDLMAWVFCLGNILDIKISDALQGTFQKEYRRQMISYGKLKYFGQESETNE